jgi:hypothetical protein
MPHHRAAIITTGIERKTQMDGVGKRRLNRKWWLVLQAPQPEYYHVSMLERHPD